MTEIDGASRPDTLPAPLPEARPRPPLPTPRRPTTSQNALKRLNLVSPIEVALAQRRLFLLLPFAMILGLVAYTCLPTLPSPWLLAGGAIVLAVALFIARTHLVWFYSLTLLAAFWTGFGLLELHGALFGTPMLDRPVFGTYRFVVEEVLSEKPGEVRSIVSAIVPVGDARSVPVRRARLVVKGTPVAPGDTLEGPVRFYDVPGPILPNGFDTQFHSYFDGVGAYGNTTSSPTLVAHGTDAGPQRLVDSIRRGIATRLDQQLQPATSGTARALITGDQSAITDEWRESLAVAGLAHVYSVSGLHLTIVAGLVLAVMRGGLALLPGMGRLVPAKRLAALTAIMASLGYYAISGGNVAALRSTLMILLVLGAVVAGRRALTMRNVAFAALAIIVTDPASVFRPSFQLSFAAVVALIGAWEAAVREPGDKDVTLVGRFGAWLLGSIATSAVAGAATLLFSIYYFQQTSPLGVLSNLLALPLIGFVMMPAALVATLAMPLGLEGPAVQVLGWSVDRMMDIANIVAGWSAGLSWSPLLQPLALMIGLGAFAWFAFFTRWHRLIGPVLAVPLILLFALDVAPDVLVADTIQATALRGTDGLELVAGKGTSFAVNVWRETYVEALPDAEAMMECDAGGCFGRSPAGFIIAMPKSAAAFYEDCPLADLVVIRRPAPLGCTGATIVDQRALDRLGTHWLRWNAASRTFDIRTAVDGRVLPWRVPAR